MEWGSSPGRYFFNVKHSHAHSTSGSSQRWDPPLNTRDARSKCMVCRRIFSFLFPNIENLEASWLVHLPEGSPSFLHKTKFEWSLFVCLFVCFFNLSRGVQAMPVQCALKMLRWSTSPIPSSLTSSTVILQLLVKTRYEISTATRLNLL